MIVRYKEMKTGIEVFFGEGVLRSIENHALRFIPKEFGGILIGFTLGKSIFIMDTKVPDKFVNSNAGFTRGADALNKYLEQLTSSTDKWLDYLGEWHSHPFGDVKFSNDDKRTMVEIGESLEINTKNPLLLIVSFKKKEMAQGLYLIDNNELRSLDFIEEIK